MPFVLYTAYIPIFVAFLKTAYEPEVDVGASICHVYS